MSKPPVLIPIPKSQNWQILKVKVIPNVSFVIKNFLMWLPMRTIGISIWKPGNVANVIKFSATNPNYWLTIDLIPKSYPTTVHFVPKVLLNWVLWGNMKQLMVKEISDVTFVPKHLCEKTTCPNIYWRTDRLSSAPSVPTSVTIERTSRNTLVITNPYFHHCSFSI